MLKDSANCGKKLKNKADEWIQLLDADKSRLSTSAPGNNDVRIRKNIGSVNFTNIFNKSEFDGPQKEQDDSRTKQVNSKNVKDVYGDNLLSKSNTLFENQDESLKESYNLSENAEDIYANAQCHEEQEQDRVDQNEDIDDDLIPFVATKKASATDFRRLIFRAGFEHFKSDLSLQVVHEINIMEQQLEPSNLGESLDHLAYRIINTNQSGENNLVLKLSLSRILFLVGGATLKVYEQLFHNQDYFNELLKRKPTMELGLSTVMASYFDEVMEKKKLGTTRTREHLMEKRLEVLRNGGGATEEMELLDILDFVISNFDYQAKKKSELAYYRYAASILDIIFRNQEFGLNDGEICSKSTKNARITNMKVCNDTNDKKPVIGRGIDLMLISMSLEVSCSEWQKADTSPALVEQQQIKNCRTNSSILHDLKKLPIAEKQKEDMFVLGMEWIGDVGFMISVKEVENAHVVHHVGDLSLPRSFAALEDFRNTLDLLYSFKHHYMKMKDVTEIAQHRYTVDQNLARYRSSEQQPSTDDEPKTFFTPVKKQKTSHPFTTHL
ncbi:hypothetical protein BD408DRAFT_430422 [Parasitella parasitica]|nr:hypothetical protein BD408DRAFT_430422 [Parasitella parasitica]